MKPRLLSVAPCTGSLISLALLVLLCTQGVAEEERQTERQAPAFKDGANCLFIGHSFFIPVARRFDKLAEQNEYSSHEVDFVFAPGMGGSPGRLWASERRRNQIEQKLATGEVELLGMTAFGRLNSNYEDYQRWIEMALKHNPKTRFFIGHCWTFGGPKMDSERYNAAIERSGASLFETVEKLRKAVPNNHIDYLNYGKIASELKSRFEAGQLPDITQMVGRNRSSLFLDGFVGHGGPMILELSALTWLDLLYDAEMQELEYSAYQSDVLGITKKVTEYNEQFEGGRTGGE